MGPVTRRVRPLRRASSWILGAAIIFAVTLSARAESSTLATKTWNFDDLGLPSLNLGFHPGMRRLSAQGNHFERLDVSGNTQLDRLLLFGNPFDRRGLEDLLSSLAGHGLRGGFLGLSDLRKQTLSLGGRVNLATLRSRKWSVPRSREERHFGLEARAYLWSPGPFARRETAPVWRYASTSDPANARPLPLSGFHDDAPRWFHVTAPEGFYSVTSIDLSNKRLLGEIDCAPLSSLFHVKLSCNDLKKLDFTRNRWLTTADLADNRLTNLNLSGNPALEELRLSNNALANLDLRDNPSLRHLDLRYNQLSAQEVDLILTVLVAHGQTGGTVLLDGGGNAAPTGRGRGAAWVLTQRSWRVQTNYDLDYDEDGLPDAWEQEMFGGGHENANGDADGDGLSNLRERLHYLDPTNADTDGDGYSDGAELIAAADPLDPNDAPPPTGFVAGVVWNDLDRDLLCEPKESGIEGIKVFLERGRGPQHVTSRTKTSADGSYRFSELPAGRYSVGIYWGDWKPHGATIKEVTLRRGDDHAEIDFALIDPAIMFSQWGVRNFGKESIDPSGDPDGDGYPNLLEYALGTHPLVANSRGSEQIESSLADEGFRFSLQYRVDPNAIDVRTVSETFRDGDWREVNETTGWSGLSRQASITVDEGEVGLLRLQARLSNDAEAVVHGPCWGGHAFVLDPGLQVSGLPLVNKRLLGGRVLRNDAVSVTFERIDAPLAELVGPERAYLEVVEGPFEGERWEVAGVQPWGDRLALAVDHAANTRLGPLPNLAGRKVVVRPHLTLGQVFGRAGQNVDAPFLVKETDRLWFLESGRLAPYHFASSEDGARTLGWSRWGDLSSFWDERPIFPGEGFFAKRAGEEGIVFLLLGEVRLNRIVIPLKAGPNFIAPAFPTLQSFAGLGLTPFGGFAANPLPDKADQGFLWNGNDFDSYFLFSDSGQGWRWVRAGDDELIDRSTLPLIGRDDGFILNLIESRRLYSPSPARSIR